MSDALQSVISGLRVLLSEKMTAVRSLHRHQPDANDAFDGNKRNEQRFGRKVATFSRAIEPVE